MQLKSVVSIRLTFVTVVVISALVASTAAMANGYNIKNGLSSGSSVTTSFNFQGTLSSADKRTTLSTFQGKDSLGDVHGQIVADYDTIEVSCSTAPFSRAFEVFFSKGVLNYDKGQLFLAADEDSMPNIGCLSFDNWPEFAPASVSLTIKYDIVGGTGDYEGASGELEVHSSGVLLHNYLGLGSADNQFGSFASDYEGWFEVD